MTSGQAPGETLGETSGDSTGSMTGAMTEPPEDNASTDPAAGPDDAVIDDPNAVDPVVSSTIRVDYEITVPAYVSDSLQVTLSRGEDSIQAHWLGDESWTIGETLPPDFATTATLTFSDDDGRLTLGTVRLDYRTGTGAMQVLQVPAERFDTGSWDDDRDGRSNLDELTSGSDPRVDESIDLERRETFDPFSSFARPTALDAMERSSSFFESSMPASFPYVQNIQAGPPDETFGYTTPGYTFRLDANLTASGEGTYASYVQTIEPDDNTIVEQDGERIVDDGRIVWAGFHERVNASSGVRNRFDFSNEYARIDDTTRRLVGVVTYDSFGTESDDTGGLPISVVYTLIGEPIDGTSACLPVAGVIGYDVPGADPAAPVASTSITRGENDADWRVTTTEADGRVSEDFLLGTLGTELFCGYRD